ncbi:MAG: flagellar motor switch protein FliM, partial [Pseudomonadota bacterium]
ETALAESLDWASRALNVRGSMPLLEVINGRFAQRFRTGLSRIMRKMVDVTPEPTMTVKYSEFQRSLPVPTSMHLFKIDPLRGPGIVVVESRLVFGLVEAFFGGTGTGSTKIEGREFTPIEKKIIEKIVQVALMTLMESWEDVYPIKTDFIRSESNPLVVNVFPGEEVLLSTKYEVELNKPLGNLTFCVPVSSFQQIRHKLSGGYRDENAEPDRVWVNSLRDRLSRAEIEMVVDLGRTELTVRDLLNLRAGDIILLENSFKNPIKAQVGGITKFQGYMGRFNNKKVFKIEGPVHLEN